jgi:hypothetical protein
MSVNDPKDPTTWTPGMVAAFNAIKPSEAQRRLRRASRGCPGCGGAHTVDAIDNHGQHYQGCARCVVASAAPASHARSPLAALEAVARAAETHFRVDGLEGSDCYDAREFRLARKALGEALSALREARR